MIKNTELVTYLIDTFHDIFQKHFDQRRFAYVNTDIDPKNDDFENTVDNGRQNEYQNNLPTPNNKNESELQNEPPVSFSHLYIQPSIVPNISNP